MNSEKRKSRIRWPYLLLSLLLWSIVLGWMWIIFSLSSETVYESSERSMKLFDFVKKQFSLNVSVFFLRKAAHFVEYAMLTLFSFFAFASTFRVSDKNPLVEIPAKEMKSSFQTNAMLSIWITVLFAVFDEYHQIFVFGRNANIIDVLIDICGGVVVLLLFRLVVAIILLHKKRSERTDLLSNTEG
jgi:VanZ family protein